jgi:hypothetical protein
MRVRTHRSPRARLLSSIPLALFLAGSLGHEASGQTSDPVPSGSKPLTVEPTPTTDQAAPSGRNGRHGVRPRCRVRPRASHRGRLGHHHGHKPEPWVPNGGPRPDGQHDRVVGHPRQHGPDVHARRSSPDDSLGPGIRRGRDLSSRRDVRGGTDLRGVGLDRLEQKFVGGPQGQMVWTLSQPTGARSWWPSKDRPHDKALVRTAWTVPETWTATGNGVLEAVRAMPGGRKKFSWPWS